MSRTRPLQCRQEEHRRGRAIAQRSDRSLLGVTRLLWVGRERTIESLQGPLFTVIGDELASKIVFVCSDMWEPYLKVIREKC